MFSRLSQKVKVVEHFHSIHCGHFYLKIPAISYKQEFNGLFIIILTLNENPAGQCNEKEPFVVLCKFHSCQFFVCPALIRGATQTIRWLIICQILQIQIWQ